MIYSSFGYAACCDKLLVYWRVLVALVLMVLPAVANGQIHNAGLPRPIQFRPEVIQTEAGDSILYEVADIAVPENRTAANSNMINICIARLKSQSSNPGCPVIFLAGGPGQSGINYIRQPYFQKLIAMLQKDQDVILLDQRGTGRSTPSLLYKTPAIDKKNIFLNSKTIIDVANRFSKAGADTFKVRSIDITGYNTVQSAEDVEAVRAALGVKKVNLLGISYGTHLALAIGRKFPKSINRMVLLGVSGLDDMHHLPAAYDEQLKRIALLASTDTAVNKDIPDMVELLKKVLSQLDKQPVLVNVDDKKTNERINLPVGKFGLQLILRLDASDSYDFIYFPAMLYEIDHGDYSLLQEYVQKRYNQFNNDYTSGIGVMRTASGASKQRLKLIRTQSKNSLLDSAVNTPDLYATNFFGKIDLGDRFRRPFDSNIPALFISGSMDANTPVSNAIAVKKRFPASAHLIVENAGHEDLLPNEDVQNAIVAFLRGEALRAAKLTMAKPAFEPVLNHFGSAR